MDKQMLLQDLSAIVGKNRVLTNEETLSKAQAQISDEKIAIINLRKQSGHDVG